MTQKTQVYMAMEKNGGYATFQQLNYLVDTSEWNTKTPDATIRRIVQNSNDFFKIKPGLWALEKYRERVLDQLEVKLDNIESDNRFTHSLYQGMVVKIGNSKHYSTFIPAQDKNKKFLETKLKEIATLESIPKFTYDNLLRRAKTVDVVWFNERQMPCGFYEIEHTTDIKNSLSKFYELQDFRASFSIIADEKRRKQFEDIISSSMYLPIRKLVKFISYDNLERQYAKESIELTEMI